MNIRFWKYHGTGNDFIIIDNRSGKASLNSSQIAGLCHRHVGIGADGLIEVKQSDTCDFRMIYYNADGFEGSMCGNGGRCITAFAVHSGLIEKEATFQAVDGLHQATVLSSKENELTIRLTMQDVKIFKTLGNDFFIDTGSPHFVKFVQDIESIDVVEEGKKIRWDKRFRPDGVNVNFAEARKKELIVKTFERGVEDHTLSCGTGNTASAMAMCLRTQSNQREYNIESPGGRVKVGFNFVNNTFTEVFLQGPAKQVFEGSINL